MTWHLAKRPGKRKLLDLSQPPDDLINRAKKAKAGIRVKLEQSFQVNKRQFGHIHTRYRGR